MTGAARVLRLSAAAPRARRVPVAASLLLHGTALALLVAEWPAGAPATPGAAAIPVAIAWQDAGPSVPEHQAAAGTEDDAPDDPAAPAPLEAAPPAAVPHTAHAAPIDPPALPSFAAQPVPLPPDPMPAPPNPLPLPEAAAETRRAPAAAMPPAAPAALDPPAPPSEIAEPVVERPESAALPAPSATSVGAEADAPPDPVALAQPSPGLAPPEPQPAMARQAATPPPAAAAPRADAPPPRDARAAPRPPTASQARPARRGAPAAEGLPAAGAPPALPVAAAGDGPILVTAPRYRRPPRPPDYPPRALDLGLTGTVLVRALVSPEGDTQETRVWRTSGHPLLDAAALAAVRRWAFEPALNRGRPVPAWVEVPIHFRLN
jgi:protein TonB